MKKNNFRPIKVANKNGPCKEGEPEDMREQQLLASSSSNGGAQKRALELERGPTLTAFAHESGYPSSRGSLRSNLAKPHGFGCFGWSHRLKKNIAKTH